MSEAGKAWVFGDDVDTDVLAPGLYMKGPFEELARHCLESVDPEFALNVAAGDVVVAGENFGIGSSREQAAQALKFLGVGAIIAKSFGGIFFRNALNFGITAVACAEAGRIKPGDEIRVDPAVGEIINVTRNETLSCDLLPPSLLAMVRDGGLVAHLEKSQISKKDKGQ